MRLGTVHHQVQAINTLEVVQDMYFHALGAVVGGASHGLFMSGFDTLKSCGCNG